MLQNRSITTHIIMVSTFLALAPLFVLSWYANYQKTYEVKELQSRHMELLLQSIIEHADTRIRHYKDLVKSLSQSPFLAQSLEEIQPNVLQLSQYLNIHKQTHLYNNIYLLKNSTILTSSNDNLPNSTRLDNVLLKHTPLALATQSSLNSKNVYLSQLAYFGPSNAPVAFIVAPITKGNESLGAIAIELSESFFFELIRSDINLGKSGEIVAAKLRSDGTIVATIPLRHNPEAFYNQEILHENTQQNGLPRAVQGESNSGITLDYRGHEVLSSWSYLPLLDWGVQIKIDTKEIRADIWQSNQTFFAFLLGIGIMVLAIAFYATRLITKPITHLTDSIKRFSEGEHIQALPGSSREITHLAQAFNSMEEKINSHLQALQDQARTIEEHNQNLEAQIAQRTKSLQESHQQITILLNNSGQGFLTIKPSLHVRPEYSKECELIFGTDITNHYLPNLVFEEEQMQTRFKKTLGLYFASNDTLQREAYLSLLDTQAHINNREISIEYRPLDSETLMLILTDVSQLRALESKLQEERGLLSFITMALKDKRQFFDAIDAYKGEVQTLQNQIQNNLEMDKQKIKTLYRKVHTYKGVFLQYALPNLPKSLHELEEDLAMRLENQDQSPYLPKDYFNKTQNALMEDMRILAHYLGQDFIDKKEALSISKEQYVALENLITKIVHKLGEAHPLSISIHELLGSLRLVPLRSLLAAYPQLAFQLALRMEKEIEHFDIEGGDFLVDPQRYADFAKAMIHLFNNAIDHGIEPPSEREESGKSPLGLLRCTITRSPGFFHIQLSDDGKGLDAQSIYEKAIERGMNIDPNSSEEELFLLIFEDGFSLKEGITQISGRGVGLSALKAETQALGGTLEVKSYLGHGSTFSFTIPFNEEGYKDEN